METLGYASNKFAATKNGHGYADFYHNDTLGGIFNKGQAWSDFPIFGFPCELSELYSKARFLYFSRNATDWFESFRRDALCRWMPSTRKHGPSSYLAGIDFMNYFWGEAFALFRVKSERLCSDFSNGAWAGLKDKFLARLRLHFRTIASCVDPERLLVTPLENADSKGLRELLGCPFDVHLPMANAEVNKRRGVPIGK